MKHEETLNHSMFPDRTGEYRVRSLTPGVFEGNFRKDTVGEAGVLVPTEILNSTAHRVLLVKMKVS